QDAAGVDVAGRSPRHRHGCDRRHRALRSITQYAAGGAGSGSRGALEHDDVQWTTAIVEGVIRQVLPGSIVRQTRARADGWIPVTSTGMSVEGQPRVRGIRQT